MRLSSGHRKAAPLSLNVNVRFYSFFVFLNVRFWPLADVHAASLVGIFLCLVMTAFGRSEKFRNRGSAGFCVSEMGIS